MKHWKLLAIFGIVVGFISCNLGNLEKEEVRYFWNRSSVNVTIKPISEYSNPFDEFTISPGDSVRLEVNSAYLEGNNGNFRYTYSPASKVRSKSNDEKFGTWFEFIDE
jgi:hypothetical protein